MRRVEKGQGQCCGRAVVGSCDKGRGWGEGKSQVGFLKSLFSRIPLFAFGGGVGGGGVRALDWGCERR